MAFAIADDVEDALGRSLTSSESDSVDNLIDRATDHVIGYGVAAAIDPVPGAVTRVVAEMVAAVFLKPAITVADYNASGYSTALESASVRVGMESATSSGPWLTNAQKMRLNPYRTGGLNQIALKSESDRSNDVWPQLRDFDNSDVY